MGYSLNRAMVLEAAQVVPDGAGGHVRTWQPLGTLWCELRPGAGRERRGEIAPTGEMGLRAYMRAAPQGSPQRPRPDQRLREGGRVFAILSVSEADPQGAYLVAYLREEVPA
jgi:head-tail adaptor